MGTCSDCPNPLPVTRGRPRLTCSTACRQRRSRRLQQEAEEGFIAAAHDLLVRQIEAIIAGDVDGLRAVQREAESLFA